MIPFGPPYFEDEDEGDKDKDDKDKDDKNKDDKYKEDKDKIDKDEEDKDDKDKDNCAMYLCPRHTSGNSTEAKGARGLEKELEGEDPNLGEPADLFLATGGPRSSRPWSPPTSSKF